MDFQGQDRREFFRINFSTPLQFKAYALEDKSKSAQQDSIDSASRGTSRNVSQSGILFQTKNHPPALSSIVWLNLDIRTLKICQEIENRALIFNNGLVGRVVRVEEDNRTQNSYDIGVCFLTKEQQGSREVQEILAEINQAA
jgi:hypothetical protein